MLYTCDLEYNLPTGIADGSGTWCITPTSYQYYDMGNFLPTTANNNFNLSNTSADCIMVFKLD